MKDRIRIGYISDLHIEFILSHMTHEYGSNLLEKLEYVLDDIYKKATSNKLDILLLVGDLGESDFSQYIMTVLSNKLKKTGIRVVSILGNHEIWWYQDFETCVKEYKHIADMSNFKLLQNDSVYWDNKGLGEVSEKELLGIAFEDLAEKLKDAKLIIFGGLGFAGYNPRFCAEQRIYRNTMNREQEFIESDKINCIYSLIKPLLKDRGIVVTHTPKRDWCRSSKLSNGIVYVSGHTHKRKRVEKNGCREYADNQIGYCKAFNNEFISIKYFEMEA